MACPVQWLPAYKPPEIMRDVPVPATCNNERLGQGLYCASSALLHYSDFPETGKQKPGMSQYIGQHWGLALLNSLALTGLDPATGLPLC